jgi:hypothetical protein
MRITTLLSLLSIFTTVTFAHLWDTSNECPIEITTVVTRDTWEARLRSSWTKRDPRFETMESVHTALLQCPNITTLDLDITDAGGSCLPDYYFPFDPQGGEVYANLTSVRLSGYAFDGRSVLCDDNPHSAAAVRWFHKTMSATKIGRAVQNLLNLAPYKTHLDLWMNAMDWSRVEHLNIEGEMGETHDGITDEMVEKLAPRLHSLKSLETRNTSFIAAVPNNTLTHLKIITYRNTETALPIILSHQGKSLERLEFRRPENVRAPFLGDFDISLLPKMAPNITHLAVNIPRNGTWPLESLSIIASLPQLQSADIYMNIQSSCAQQRGDRRSAPYFKNYWDREAYWDEHCTGEEQFQQPFVDREGALEMFKYMREEKTGVALSNVTFYVGDWRVHEESPGCLGWDWFDRNRAKVVCHDEGDGGADDEAWCFVEEGGEYWVEKQKPHDSLVGEAGSEIELFDIGV